MTRPQSIALRRSVRDPRTGIRAYVAAKHAVAGLARQLARDLGEYGVAVNGYVWNGDFANDDLPHAQQTANGPIVLLPRANAFVNDLVMWIFPKNSPQAIWESFKDTFDQLDREGRNGSPIWIAVVLHAQFAGRPAGIPLFRNCVEYAKQHEGVWFARKGGIARWTPEREGIEGSKAA